MFVSLDLETTGVFPDRDKIIEFGAVKFDLEGNTETLQFLVNPNIPLQDIITHITGLTDEDLANAPLFSSKIEEVEAFIGDCPIIGHNIQFDINFLRHANVTVNNPQYDTCQLTSILVPGLPSYSLEILSELFDLEHEEKHRALDDAIAAMNLFKKLTNHFKALTPDLIAEIKTLIERSEWPVKTFLQTLEHDQEAKKIDPKELKPELPENPNVDTKQILDEEESTLFEINAPYRPVILDVAAASTQKTIISVPYQTFLDLQTHIPETVTKIDSPRRYISYKRFQQFLKRPHFEENEITSILKFLIWSKQTTTGLLSEATLFNEERIYSQKVCIDKNYSNPQEEFFYKKTLSASETAPVICTHQYLIEEKPTSEKLYLFDLDNYSKTVFACESSYIRIDHLTEQLKEISVLYPENIEVDTLLNKCTILFGLIGMAFEKHKDSNAYAQRAQITKESLSSDAFIKVQETIGNIAQLSANLDKISNEETQGDINSFKDILRELYLIFFEPDEANFFYYIEQDFDLNTIIKKVPYSIKAPSTEVFARFNTTKILSDNLDLNDDATFSRTLNGIPESFKLHKNLQKKENVETLLINDLSIDNVSEDAAVQFLTTYLKDKGRTAIICTSKQKIQFFTLKLGQGLPDKKIISQTTGSLGKITEQYKQNPDNSIILLTPNFWENFRNHDEVDTVIIHKVPFDPPSDPYITAMSKNFKDPFNEFQVPRAIFSLKKIINKATNTKKPKKIIILDSRITQKGYGRAFQDNIKDLATTKIVNLASFSANVKANT